MADEKTELAIAAVRNRMMAMTFHDGQAAMKEAYERISKLEAERDELKAGRASFFDVHAKMQDRLSDAEADNSKLRNERDSFQGQLRDQKNSHQLTFNAYAKLKAAHASTLETLREVTDALEFYGTHVTNCTRTDMTGDRARDAIAKDYGQRASKALAKAREAREGGES